MGVHIETVDPKKLIPLLKIYFTAAVTYNAAQAAYKVTALCLYLRIFGRNRTFRIAAWTYQGIVVVYTIISILIYTLWQCTPPKRAWDPTVKGSCHNMTV